MSIGGVRFSMIGRVSEVLRGEKRRKSKNPKSLSLALVPPTIRAWSYKVRRQHTTDLKPEDDVIFEKWGQLTSLSRPALA